MRVVSELRHQSFEINRRSRDVMKRHSMWLYDNRAPS